MSLFERTLKIILEVLTVIIILLFLYLLSVPHPSATSEEMIHQMTIHNHQLGEMVRIMRKFEELDQ